MVNVGSAADPIVTRLVEEDKTPWYKKPNLRLILPLRFISSLVLRQRKGVGIPQIYPQRRAHNLGQSPANRIQAEESRSWTLRVRANLGIDFGNGRTNEDGDFAIEPGLLGFVNSSYQLGSIFGVPLAPWFAHRYGRRWSIMLGSLIMVGGALLQGFAQHVAMYIIARMLLGVGILFCIISGAALIGELGHPKERAILTSLFNSSYFIGQITASAIALGTTNIPSNWAWRVPSLLQICPSLLQIATVFLLPESPRFLVANDRSEEAAAILVKYHAEGDANSQLVQAEIVQIRETIKTEMEVSKQSWLDLLRTSGMRRRVLVTVFIGLFTQLSGNTLISYYSGILFQMMGYTSNYAKTRINLAYACWGLINATIIALVVTRFKRRHMYMLSACLMLVTFIAITVSLERLQAAQAADVKNSAAGIAALFFYFAYSPTYNIGNNALTYTYLVELWPYAQRSRGIGVQQIFGKLAGFFSTNVNSIALNAIKWRYLAIYCGWIFFEFCIVFMLYPETSGRTLEELTFLFEDDEFNEKTVAAVEKQIHFGDQTESSKQEGNPTQTQHRELV